MKINEGDFDKQLKILYPDYKKEESIVINGKSWNLVPESPSLTHEAAACEFLKIAQILHNRIADTIITNDVIDRLIGDAARVNQLIGNDKEGVEKKIKREAFFKRVKQFFCFHKYENLEKFWLSNPKGTAQRCSKCRKIRTIGGK